MRCLRQFSTKASAERLKFVLLGESAFSDTIKKSKFIAKTYPVNTIDEALTVLERVSDLKATHNCWAFNSLDYQRYSDDGEPSGTAGRPILNALSAENVVNALVVCTRYYGGINLGTGGLTRAYGGTALQALKLARKEVYRPMQVMQLEVTHRDLGGIQSILKQYSILSQQFASDPDSHSSGSYEGKITLQVNIPVEESSEVEKKVMAFLAGRGKLTLV